LGCRFKKVNQLKSHTKHKTSETISNLVFLDTHLKWYLNKDNHWSKGIRVAGFYENRHLPWELYFDLPKDEKEFYDSLQKFSFYTPKK
jgi:hypothetical protein